MKYITIYPKGSPADTATAAFFMDIPAESEWLLLGTSEKTISVGVNTNIDEEVNLNAIDSDGLKLSRRGTVGGVVLLDPDDVLIVGLKSNSLRISELFLKVLDKYGICGEIQNNDIVVDGKKIIGFGSITVSGDRKSAGMVNIGVTMEQIAKYVRPTAMKLERHGNDYMQSRVGRLKEYVPEITWQALVETFVEVFGEAEEIPFQQMIEEDNVKKALSILGGRAWRIYGVMPEGVYKVQEIIFNNGKTIQIEEIRGSIVNNRESLILVIPEQTGITFNELKAIFVDKEATKIFTVVYGNQTDEGEATKQNLQTGFIVPMSLSYEGDKYLMTLGKQTQQEHEYDELLARVAALEKIYTEK